MNLQTVMRPTESANELIKMCNFLKEKYKNINTLIEIGSYMGESAEIFAKQFPNTKIICIDPWEGNFDIADGCSFSDYTTVESQFDLRTKNYTNIFKKKGYSTSYEIECDIVYIDGCHKYECVFEDISHWKKYTKLAICGHDYYNDYIDKIQPHTAGVRKAVNELLGIPDKIFADGSYIKLIQ